MAFVAAGGAVAVALELAEAAGTVAEAAPAIAEVAELLGEEGIELVGQSAFRAAGATARAAGRTALFAGRTAVRTALLAGRATVAGARTAAELLGDEAVVEAIDDRAGAALYGTIEAQLGADTAAFLFNPNNLGLVAAGAAGSGALVGLEMALGAHPYAPAPPPWT